MIMYSGIMTIGDTESNLEYVCGKLSLKKDIKFGWQRSYRFINQLTGNAYYIDAVNGDDELNEMFDADLECDNDEMCPFWVNNLSRSESLYPLIVNEEYYNDYCRLVYHCMANSGNKVILFLPKFAETRDELIAGVINFKKFLRLLSERQILCGISYVITL